MPIVLDKPEGWSLLEAIETLRANDPSLARARMGYAGRLDPLAQGVLVVLCDAENREASRFCSFDKRYRIEVLFGVCTDTFDPLGLADATVDPSARRCAVRVGEVLPLFIGTMPQKVPAFSSRRVNGRPLFHWARRGLADTVPRPAPSRTIASIVIERAEEIAPDVLLASIESRVRNVRGDFRQNAIIARWQDVLGSWRDPLATATLVIDCSSGTFMRTLADDLGRALGTRALALRIARERVGPFDRESARRFPDGTARVTLVRHDRNAAAPARTVRPR